jgi:hypothetical protein
LIAVSITEFEASGVLLFDQAFLLEWVQLLPSQAGELLAVPCLPSVRDVEPGTLASFCTLFGLLLFSSETRFGASLGFNRNSFIRI